MALNSLAAILFWRRLAHFPGRQSTSDDAPTDATDASDRRIYLRLVYIDIPLAPGST